MKITSSLAMNSFAVEDTPDLSEMTMCLWLKVATSWQNDPSKRMYLVAYDLDISDQLTANSFFLALDNDKKLEFGIGREVQTW